MDGRWADRSIASFDSDRSWIRNKLVPLVVVAFFFLFFLQNSRDANLSRVEEAADAGSVDFSRISSQLARVKNCRLESADSPGIFHPGEKEEKTARRRDFPRASVFFLRPRNSVNGEQADGWRRYFDDRKPPFFFSSRRFSSDRGDDFLFVEVSL